MKVGIHFQANAIYRCSWSFLSSIKMFFFTFFFTQIHLLIGDHHLWSHTQTNFHKFTIYQAIVYFFILFKDWLAQSSTPCGLSDYTTWHIPPSSSRSPIIVISSWSIFFTIFLFKYFGTYPHTKNAQARGYSLFSSHRLFLATPSTVQGTSSSGYCLCFSHTKHTQHFIFPHTIDCTLPLQINNIFLWFLWHYTLVTILWPL